MTIQFNCDCGQTIKVKDTAAGKKIKCPSCAKSVEAPSNASTDDATYDLDFATLAQLERESKPITRKTSNRNTPYSGQAGNSSNDEVSPSELRAMKMSVAANEASAEKLTPINTTLWATIGGVVVSLGGGGPLVGGAVAFFFFAPLIGAINSYRLHRSHSEGEERLKETIKCPDCARTVLAALRRCPFCDYSLTGLSKLIRRRNKMMSWVALLVVMYLFVVSFASIASARDPKNNVSATIIMLSAVFSFPFGIPILVLLFKAGKAHAKIRRTQK